MYLKISPPAKRGNSRQGIKQLVDYLEKENQGKTGQDREFFFDQTSFNVHPSKVIEQMEYHTQGLKKRYPKYYCLTLSPSQRELDFIRSDKLQLKKYVRAVMEEYARNFKRDLGGRPVEVNDIVYYAKIETRRRFRGNDQRLRDNQPFLRKLEVLKREIEEVKRHRRDVKDLEEEFRHLVHQIPHKTNGRIIVPGMSKQGPQNHVHVILSRRDASRTYGLSPGGPHRHTRIYLHDKPVVVGFDRDRFFQKAQNTFDRLFQYPRNYAESYAARKLFKRNPYQYYTELQRLSKKEKLIAFDIMADSGSSSSGFKVSRDTVALALKQVKKALELASRTSAIEY